MKRHFLLCTVLSIHCLSIGQQKKNTVKKSTVLARPKLVVGLVVDQMRWDYLYRFHDLYVPNGGFKRLLGEGFTCENTFIPYLPTVTAAGHTCIYTGSVPAIHGIVGNSWYDNKYQKNVYCTDDSTVATVGSTTVAVGKMSPHNLFATTIGDELRLATNFRGKVIGVACKDRASILPAGHTPNGAYWYDVHTGNFVTSTYYRNELPDWVSHFNNRHIVDSLYRLNWNLIAPENVYLENAARDDAPYEATPLQDGQRTFPYELQSFAGKDYARIMSTPYANTLTAELAKAAIKGEDLGKDDITDLLAVSFSSPDYIGHAYGPNSWEQLDDYLRLDREIGSLLDFLDQQVGKGNYTVFLSADHGVAHIADYLKENKLPGGAFSASQMRKDMNDRLKDKYGFGNIILAIDEYKVLLNNELLSRSENINREDLTNWIINYLLNREEISAAFAINRIGQAVIPEVIRERATNGYYAQRSGQIEFIVKPGYYDGANTGTTHGEWNPYDAHIPLLWYGWGINHGTTNRETYMTDIAPTIAALLHIQMPSGTVGKVILEALK